MTRLLHRGVALLAVIAAGLIWATGVLAQMPASPWKKAAAFPEPDEELYGVAANGNLYVIGGWDDGKAGGVNYEYDPGTNKWTKKQPMPRPAHHAALAAANGKVYVMGGFEKQSGATTAVTERYDIRADRWRRVADMPAGLNHAAAVAYRGDVYVIGGYREFYRTSGNGKPAAWINVSGIQAPTRAAV